ncbi:MAG: right-handed parallel beta-helix repeat-containing protein [Ruminococcaceae bacterium]|nr:right-handed parallel beta-helix repeat-containing protein [Oscillospiraceae bacterium]
MAIELERVISEQDSANTLAEAKEKILAAARAAKEAGRHDKIIIEIGGGDNFITEPLVLSGKENPELSSLDITIRGKDCQNAYLQSWQHVWHKDFTPHPDRPYYYTYQFPKNEDGKYPLFHELSLNGKPLKYTKSPVWLNRIPLTEEERQGKVKREGFYVPLEIAKALAEGEIGSTELFMCIEWEYAIFHVASVDLDTTCEIDGVKHALVKLWDGEMDFFCEKLARHLNIGKRESYFQNSPAFLTEPDTFAYDYKNGILHLLLRPEDVKPPRGFAVQYANLETLIELECVDNVTIERLNFMGVTNKYVCENVITAGQANNIRGKGRLRNAAILADTVRNLTVRDCSFNGLGSNGVQVINYSAGVTVKDCIFKNIGASGVTIGNPTWNWQEEHNRTYHARVENNYFENIACDFPAAPAIYIAQVDGLKILHNTVEGCSYSAISVGWNWAPVTYELGERVNIRDAEIAYNVFHNYMQLLKDGGAVYVLGSNCNHETTSERFNLMHDNFAYLDTLVKAYGKYGYYCDGACSNWEVRDSVVINTDGMPIFSQPHPQALSYHNTFKNIYSTTQRHPSTHVPERDIITLDYHLVEEGADALFAKHPEVKAIRDAAGASMIV